MKDVMNRLRRWSRILHRDLSYIFSGILLVYAMSGFMLNHKNDFNANYSIEQHRYSVDNLPDTIDNSYARYLLERWGEQGNFTAVYDVDEDSFKIFIRGGSSLLVNRTNGDAVYESVKKRYAISAINRLHYNPTRWWTIFSDIFLLSLILIILTGLVLAKGKHGLIGRGGIEFVIGLLIPVLFMIFG